MPKNENDEIEKLKDELQKSKITIKKLESKIKELENKIKNNIVNDMESQEVIMTLTNTISMNEEKMKALEKENENHKNMIKSINEENIKQKDLDSKLYKMEDIISLNFTSTDQKINYSLPCVKNDIFAFVEEKLYKEFPEYRETNNFFVQKGQTILRFKTLKENNINPGFPILLIKPSE